MATTTTDNYGFPSNAPTIGESVSDAAEWLKKHRASLVEALLLESTRRNGECLLTEPEAMALTAKLNSDDAANEQRLQTLRSHLADLRRPPRRTAFQGLAEALRGWRNPVATNDEATSSTRPSLEVSA
jgi:hypothetical protein